MCGDSESLGIQTPGGWGACGQPNDGFHQYIHLLNKSFCQVSVQWGDQPMLRRCLDEMRISPQGSYCTKPLECIPILLSLSGILTDRMCQIGSASLCALYIYYAHVIVGQAPPPNLTSAGGLCLLQDVRGHSTACRCLRVGCSPQL